MARPTKTSGKGSAAAGPEGKDAAESEVAAKVGAKVRAGDPPAAPAEGADAGPPEQMATSVPATPKTGDPAPRKPDTTRHDAAADRAKPAAAAAAPEKAVPGQPKDAPASKSAAKDAAKPAGGDAGARPAAPRPAGEPTADMAAAATPPGAGRDALAPMPVPQGSGGGFAAGLLGGALAVAAGIGILWVSNPDLLRGDYATDLVPLTARVDAGAAETGRLAAEVADLRAALAALPAAGDPEARITAMESELTARIEALSEDIAALSSALDVLEGRVGQVEVRPPVMEGDAAAVTAEIVAEMRAALDAQRAETERLIGETRARIAAAEAEATELQDAAAAAARATVARAAFSRLAAALDAGGPFAGALQDLSRVSDAPVPPALLASAETGVPTLAALRTGFPAAAREALAASIRAGVGNDAGTIERLGAFLRAQTGARSITAREGDDPDAVLSRAEAALAEGRLGEAIALIDLLPDAGREAMAGWRAEAERRAGALAAAEALSAALPAN